MKKVSSDGNSPSKVYSRFLSGSFAGQKIFFPWKVWKRSLQTIFPSSNADLFVIDTTAAAASVEVSVQAQKNLKRLKDRKGKVGNVSLTLKGAFLLNALMQRCIICYS